MCPRRANDPASGHPRAHQPPLGRGTSPPAWDGRLDAPGQRRRHLPSSAWARRREVKQGKSGVSVGTTDRGEGKGRSVVRPKGTTAYGGKGQGKGKGRGEGRLGQGGRGRSKGGEKPMGTTAYGGKGSKGRAANGDRPVGAASCKRDHHTMASCQNPPLGMSQGGERPRGTTAHGGKGSKGRAANCDRPVVAASCRREQHTMASCQNLGLDAKEEKCNKASPWALLAQPTKGLEREGVVRGPWAPRPMEGKAKVRETEIEREG